MVVRNEKSLQLSVQRVASSSFKNLFHTYLIHPLPLGCYYLPTDLRFLTNASAFRLIH